VGEKRERLGGFLVKGERERRGERKEGKVGDDYILFAPCSLCLASC